MVLGLSGGIDSALVAAMAVDALGAERVHCVMLPYRYTSQDSLVDAAACAKALGVRYDMVPIEEPVGGLPQTLTPMFAGTKRDITEENLQSRARGTILMAISNKFGVDGADDRQQVRNVGRLCHALWRHERRLQSDQGSLQDGGLPAWRKLAQQRQGLASIPRTHHHQARPSAELRENQTDQDSLPPYEVLDDILDGLVDEEVPSRDIVAARP